MIGWLIRLFKRDEIYAYTSKKGHTVRLKRRRVANFETPRTGVMGGGAFLRHAKKWHVMSFRAYDYWCECGQKLEDGPCGGGSVNAVCEKCRINYGCLPGFFPH